LITILNCLINVSSKPTIDTEPAKIAKLSVGCGSCTKAIMKESIIPAGKSATLSVEFTPGTTGPTTKYVKVAYDKGIIKLEFTADVE
jgi:hypothetical protein